MHYYLFITPLGQHIKHIKGIVVRKNNLYLARLQGISAIRMKIIYVIASMLLLISPENFRNFTTLVVNAARICTVAVELLSAAYYCVMLPVCHSKLLASVYTFLQCMVLSLVSRMGGVVGGAVVAFCSHSRGIGLTASWALLCNNVTVAHGVKNMIACSDNFC